MIGSTQPVSETDAQASPALQRALVPELEELRITIAPEHYAFATARHFAPGGTYNPLNTRPRYAKT